MGRSPRDGELVAILALSDLARARARKHGELPPVSAVSAATLDRPA